jgi:hypothetical protein
LIAEGLLLDGVPVFGGDCVLIRAPHTIASEIDPDALESPTTSSNNYPNPFNPATKIQFDLPAPAHTTLEIFNVVGQHIATLQDGNLEAGEHVFQWDGTDQDGIRVSSGIYFYRLEAGEAVVTKKMVLIK